MRSLSRTLLTFLATIVVGGIAVGACLAALIPGTVEVVTAHHYTAEQVGELKQLDAKSHVYWDDGSTELGQLGLHDSEPVTVNQVPKRIVDAVIATEDRTFWTNDGIDLGAVARAFLANLTSGKIEQGGSTITQQLVKNRILSSKRDVNRKVKEIEDALRLNRKFSKQKILEEYLNTVYFGSGSYGIKSAAGRLFTTVDPGGSLPRPKHMDELTIGEAALLAGLISNPEGDNPFTHPERAYRRRADVLRSEVEQGYITQAQSDAANNEPLPKIPPSPEIRPQSYLVAEVQDQLLNDPRLGATAKERRDRLLKGGLKIYTTFNQNFQNEAQNATDNHKPQSPAGPDWLSSLVAIDPTTGAVKAMIGGPDFASSQYNIATHPVGRQPGSTWKVITLAAALENGYSPDDRVSGDSPCSVPSVFPDPAAYTVNAEEGGGIETLWSATAGSVNCAFVRLSTSVGQDKLIDYAHKMGITQNTLQKILTLSIGSIEETPMEMATVMATIASGGIHHRPYVVQKVVGTDGKVWIDETGNPGEQVLDKDVANCEMNILNHVVVGPENHTGGNAAIAGETVFGKTGTSDKKANAWFIGANDPGSPVQLATAVWFGNRTGNVEGAGFGGDAAAPIFQAFMSAALGGEPDTPLPDAGPVCARPGEFVNPDGGRVPPGGLFVPTVPTQPGIVQVPTQSTPTPAPTSPSPPAATAPTTPTVPPIRRR